MTKAETVRAYLTEPILSALVLSFLFNEFGKDANLAFMHDEARDVLSLFVVLLAAAMALWIGLFWISSSDFGQWLANKRMLEPINLSYIASAVILLTSCVLCILCAHASVSHTWLQLVGEYFALYGLVSIATLLNNTRHLLRLHGEFARQLKLAEIKTIAK
jgi:hypothetical protein